MSVDFLDSNIFVYLFDEKDRHRRKIAEALVNQAISDGSGCISFQVVQETLNVITRKSAKPASAADARRFMDRVLLPLWRVMPSQALYHRSLEIQARYRYSYYDSLIIAAALEAGSARLQSEDLQDGQRIEGLSIENPFKR
jgi:predicted nucleic acid-binding protein